MGNFRSFVELVLLAVLLGIVVVMLFSGISEEYPDQGVQDTNQGILESAIDFLGGLKDTIWGVVAGLLGGDKAECIYPSTRDCDTGLTAAGCETGGEACLPSGRWSGFCAAPEGCAAEDTSGDESCDYPSNRDCNTYLSEPGCELGKEFCLPSGKWGVCVVPEGCGEDNGKDGEIITECTYPSKRACNTGLTAAGCEVGTEDCLPSGQWCGVCVAPPGCEECLHGETRECVTGLTGVCGYGTESCEQGKWSSSCTPNYEVGELNESCGDGLDNDCDGEVDCDDSDCLVDALCTIASGSIVIVDNGQANAEIVYAAGGRGLPQAAANELAGIIQRISGASVGVRSESQTPGNPKNVEMHIGKTSKVDELINQGKISFAPALESYSDDEYSFATAVDGEKTYILIEGNPNPYFNEGGVKFGVRGFAEDYFGVRWYMPGDDASKPGDYWSFYPSSATVSVNPISVRFVSPAFESRVLSGANMTGWEEDIKWCKRNKLAQRHEVSHNEWKIHSIAADTHIVFSNPANVTEARNYVNSFFVTKPGVPSFSLGINDNLNYNQQDLIGGSATAAVFNYTNQVAASKPEKLFTQLAYQYAEDPQGVPQLESNVIPYLTRDTSFWVEPSTEAEHKAHISGWGGKASNIGLYDYYYGAPMLLPRFDPEIVGESIGKFDSAVAGKKGFYAEAYPNWGLDGFKNYIAAKLLWNPNLEAQAIVDEFCDRMFGAGSEKMKQYFSELESIWMDATQEQIDVLRTPGTIREKITQLEFTPPEKMQTLKGLLQQAKNAAAWNSYAVARIETIETQVDYLYEWVKMYYEVKELSGLTEQQMGQNASLLVPRFVAIANDLKERPDLEAIDTLTGTTLAPRIAGESYRTAMERYGYDYEQVFSKAMEMMEMLAENNEWELALELAGIGAGADLESDDEFEKLRVGVVVKYLDLAGETTRINVPKSGFEVANIAELESNGWHFSSAYPSYQKVESEGSNKFVSLWGTFRAAGSNYGYVDLAGQGISLGSDQYYYISADTRTRRVFERAGHSRAFVEVTINGQSDVTEVSTEQYGVWFLHTVLLKGLPTGTLNSARYWVYASDQADADLGQTADQSDKADYDDLIFGIVDRQDIEDVIGGSQLPPQPKTCSDWGGITCSSGESCEGSWLTQASDTDKCCDGSCYTPVEGQGEYYCDTQNCYAEFDGAETIKVTVSKNSSFASPIIIEIGNKSLKINLDSTYDTQGGAPVWVSGVAPSTTEVGLGGNEDRVVVSNHWNSGVYTGAGLDKGYELSFTENSGLRIKTTGAYGKWISGSKDPLNLRWPLAETRIDLHSDLQGNKLNAERVYLHNGYVGNITNQTQNISWERGTGPQQIGNRYFGIELSNGIYEFQTMDLPPRGFIFSPKTGIYSLTQGDSEPEYVLYFSEQGINETMVRYREDISEGAPSTFSDIAGKLVFYGDDDFDTMIMKARGEYPRPSQPHSGWEKVDHIFFEEFTQRGGREFVWITQHAGCLCENYWEDNSNCSIHDERDCSNLGQYRISEEEYFDDYDAVYMPYTNTQHISAAHDPISCGDVAYKHTNPWSTTITPESGVGNIWAKAQQCYNPLIDFDYYGNPPAEAYGYTTHPGGAKNYLSNLGGSRKYYVIMENSYSKEQACNLQTVESIKQIIGAQGVFVDVTGQIGVDPLFRVTGYSGVPEQGLGLKCGQVDLVDYVGDFEKITKEGVVAGIRDYFEHVRGDFGGSTPIYTEQGQDYLVGAVDGFTAGHWKPEGISVSDWEFYPITSLVHHNRVAFAGAGRIFQYSGLYGLKDFYDYLATTILFGSPGFIDIYQYAYSGNTSNPIDTYQEAMEMYYLSQAAGKNVAVRKISSVEEKGNIHRYKVRYNNGTNVYVNRGSSDWSTQGKVLPEYGFYITGNNFEEYYAKEGSAKIWYVNNLGSGDSHEYVYAQVENGSKNFPEVTLSAGSERAGLAIKKNVNGNDLVAYVAYNPENDFTINLSALGISGSSCSVEGVYGFSGSGYNTFSISSTLNGNQLTVQPYSGRVWRYSINCS